MRLSVPRLRRVLLGAGFLAGMAAAFAAGMCFASGAQSGCLHTGGSDRPAGCSALLPCCVHDEPAAQPLPPEKWVCLTFDDGPSKTTPDVLSALNAAGVHGTFFVVATGYNEKYLPLLTQRQRRAPDRAALCLPRIQRHLPQQRRLLGGYRPAKRSALRPMWMPRASGICAFRAAAPTPSAAATAAKV